jgi:GntR family transcriptional regulator
MISFYLETDSGLPAYLQLARQVEHAIRLGRLQAGDQLPSVRDVVAELAINPNTVAKAYRDLETRGLLDSRQGRGTFVREGVGLEPSAHHLGLQRKLRRWVNEAIAAGLTREDVAALCDSAIHEIFAEGVA